MGCCTEAPSVVELVRYKLEERICVRHIWAWADPPVYRRKKMKCAVIDQRLQPDVARSVAVNGVYAKDTL